MSAEVNLDGGREPAQPKGVAFGKQERCLRQIHFACNELHPSIIHRLVQEAHRRRVARDEHHLVALGLVEAEHLGAVEVEQ